MLVVLQIVCEPSKQSLAADLRVHSSCGRAGGRLVVWSLARWLQILSTKQQQITNVSKYYAYNCIYVCKCKKFATTKKSKGTCGIIIGLLFIIIIFILFFFLFLLLLSLYTLFIFNAYCQRIFCTFLSLYTFVDGTWGCFFRKNFACNQFADNFQ